MGALVGDMLVGDTVGAAVGVGVGVPVGVLVGDAVGAYDGAGDGTDVGVLVGSGEGYGVGYADVGRAVGAAEGRAKISYSCCSIAFDRAFAVDPLSPFATNTSMAPLCAILSAIVIGPPALSTACADTLAPKSASL